MTPSGPSRPNPGSPEPLESVLRRVLAAAGLPAPGRIKQLRGDWDRIAGDPWKGQSTPLLLQDRQLVVEANAAQLVSFLRYATGDLLRRLDQELGAGLVDTIRVVPPRTR